MKKSRELENFFAYFACLLSGISFFSLPADAENFASAILTQLFTLAVVFAVLCPFLKIKNSASTEVKNEKSISNLFFSILGAIFCAAAYAFFTKTFVLDLPSVSHDFSGGRFSHFFVFLSLLLSLYIGKRSFFSYSGVSLLVLPILVLPFFLTFFNFLEYKDGFDVALFAAKPAFCANYFFDALINCAGISTLIFLNPRGGGCDKKGLGAAFLAFAIFAVFEGAKYLLWFGKENLPLVVRPDRTMLSQVPFMNVQEIFLFSWYFAYMLKIVIFSTATRIFVQNVLGFGAKRKRPPEWQGYLLTVVLLYSAFLFLPYSQSKTFALAAFLGSFVCCFSFLLAKSLKNRRKSGKAS